MGGVCGAVLSPLPDGGLRFEEDGALAWDASGRLVDDASGAEALPGDPLLLVPGFVDVHIHLPQFRVRLHRRQKSPRGPGPGSCRLCHRDTGDSAPCNPGRAACGL